jgi:hypothetical protein
LTLKSISQEKDMELNKQLGQGGAGMHTTAPGSAAEALKALFGLRVSLVTGGAANAKLALADIRPGDTILAARDRSRELSKDS